MITRKGQQLGSILLDDKRVGPSAGQPKKAAPEKEKAAPAAKKPEQKEAPKAPAKAPAKKETDEKKEG